MVVALRVSVGSFQKFTVTVTLCFHLVASVIVYVADLVRVAVGDSVVDVLGDAVVLTDNYAPTALLGVEFLCNMYLVSVVVMPTPL